MDSNLTTVMTWEQMAMSAGAVTLNGLTEERKGKKNKTLNPKTSHSSAVQLPQRSAVWNRRASALSCAVGWSLTHNGIPRFHLGWFMLRLVDLIFSRDPLWRCALLILGHRKLCMARSHLLRKGCQDVALRKFHLEPTRHRQHRVSDCQWCWLQWFSNSYS